jgi:hypothetical protein
MRRNIFLTLLFIPFLGIAQYKSIFGSSSTKWNYAILLVDYTRSDSLWIVKDTTVNDTTWKKIIGNPSTNFYGGLLYEDTTKGKVWYKSLGVVDTASSLCFDFSLSVGDVFNIKNGWKNYSLQEMTVDSVYFKDNRKHIQFKGGLGWGSQILEKFTFIEGVGSNISPVYKDSSQKNIPGYLLCSAKNGTYEYLNKLFNGNCWVNVSSLMQEEISQKITVFPTVFLNNIYITEGEPRLIREIFLYNASGKLITKSSFQQKLDLTYLLPGMYFLVLRTRSGNQATKKILKL